MLAFWALPAYAIRTPDTLQSDTGTFQIVFGKVLNAEVKDGRVYLNFGAGLEDRFHRHHLARRPEDLPPDGRRSAGLSGQAGAGARHRASLDGPEIEIGNPKQIELLQ